MYPSATDDALPLVVDSPHSCRAMPPVIGCIAPETALMTGVDAYVDELWSSVPYVGGELLCANFHRCFVDANRSALDIDQDMLETPWPTLTQTSNEARRGMGLIRRFALPGVPMYDRKLTVREVQHRIHAFHTPYYERLNAAMDAAVARFGQAWHIDCHSMKSVGNAMNADAGQSRPDLVISDAEGTSCDPAFTQWVADVWQAKWGYQVAVNHPYKGGEIIRRVGKPLQNRHSVQIEINRGIYMNEATFEKTANFDRLASHIDVFLHELRDYIHSRLQPEGAQVPGYR
ncbi:hypothetical protein UC35_07015 [Ramlibacter tataouinensis]|uniref:N-formylglutamate amidohydrolase n=1 Tax=Ramlibacter tataouinensis TaxID=94132 RepID=A0A127JZI1_9BURK|nr:N-formylglutamate amidohydrolase [Ramlibacter tataouinensis]AMO25305.1 hypothetical protein UC35_07015 [Ramlibacter tataouinensis]